jgi:mannose-6-phosphate isomerase-like protein (cupin superfamily)
MNGSTEHKKDGYHVNIEELTLANTNFRKVLYTGKHLQLVLMSLKPGEEIGEEVHTNGDQFFRFENGTGTCVLNGVSSPIKAGDAIIVPHGALHNIINSDSVLPLKLYTIYSPPQHKDKVIRLTKHDAETQKESYDNRTTE